MEVGLVIASPRYCDLNKVPQACLARGRYNSETRRQPGGMLHVADKGKRDDWNASIPLFCLVSQSAADILSQCRVRRPSTKIGLMKDKARSAQLISILPYVMLCTRIHQSQIAPLSATLGSAEMSQKSSAFC